MITVPELTKWSGISAFELLLHALALLATSILLFFKLNYALAMDYWHVFSPLFVASALNCYFLLIIFVRAIIEERQFKRAFLSNVFNFLRAILIFLFEAMLCYKLRGDLERGQVAVESTYAAVLMPVWVLMVAWGFYACKLLQ